MNKHYAWIPINDQCPDCGDDLEVYTDLPDGSFYDGDKVRCVGCGQRGYMTVDEDFTGYAEFPYDE